MKISIIVPVYNVEQYIEKCLDSIELLDDTELIIIDDCSPDNTLNIIKKWIAKQSSPNIILLCNETNKGEGHTINRGLDLASGEYIGILDSDDDYLLPTSVMYPYFDGINDMVFYNLIINNGDVWVVNEQNKWNYTGATKFYRREFVGLTRRNEAKRKYGDADFYCELIKKDPIEVFTDINLYHYNFPRKGSAVDEEMERIKNNGNN